MFKRQMKLLVALLLIAGTANVFAGGPGETIRNSSDNPKHREQILKKIQSNEVFSDSTGKRVVRPVAVLTRAAIIAAQNEAAKKEKRAAKVAAALAASQAAQHN